MNFCSMFGIMYAYYDFAFFQLVKFDIQHYTFCTIKLLSDLTKVK